MTSKATSRTEAAVRQAVAAIVEDEIADPRLTLVSITQARVTPDHEQATIHYSILSPDVVSRDPARTGGDRVHEPHEVAAGFEAARPRIQGLLARRVRLRRTPVLIFEPDPVTEQAARVEELIRRVRGDGGRGQ
jgi:ribosome-binding factor A